MATIAELPNYPQYDGEELREWATYMARQLALHIAGQSPSKPLRAVKAIAWALGDGNCEARLGQNPMKMVNEMTIASGVLDGVVQVVTKWSKGGSSTTIGIGTLIEPNVVAVCGHLLRSDNDYAVEVEVIAGNRARVMGNYVVVPKKWLVRLDAYHENDIGMIHLEKPLEGVHPIDYVQTPFTDSLSGRSMLGSVYGFPERFPQLCVSEMKVQFSLTRNSGWVEHTGDTMKGNSGGPIVDMYGRLVAVHGGWKWANKKKTKMINVAAPVNRMGNDFDVLREILIYMTVNPGASFKVGAKFLASKAGGVTEVTAIRHYSGSLPKIAFEWH
ncbi:trypsin-like cysteine/serine peptidase domain-containing protein [Annulohypoxylon maeteangense]|uniref:trypsin-like cysteine/serine peptidase domain-containing protein n=1 Tax=Annulohypoxylon maeteangense TaxID=1927788 RepID=UPI0020089188|nr:trypsin-like cysteine/serine peptidase domain-containing protein [Annulohypoxylon maeteangense]KAI0883944.1 trypsin-like cysteine/serine peptidase domain-containing protein [Annulohypoxylon maeteangense]